MKLINKLSKEKQEKLYNILKSWSAKNASYEIINNLDDFLANQGFILEIEENYPEWKYAFKDGEYIGVLYSIYIDMWKINLMHKGSTYDDDVLITSMRFNKIDDLMSYMEECNEIN